jgi:S-DNA-T family DNA segregation ATPase FtsK/SpoIIIE
VRAVTVVQVINVAVQHPVARHALYVPGGLVALARGWKRRRTLATALAEQAGTANGPLALQFLQQAELERKGRAERRAQDVGMLKDLVSLWKPVLAIWVFLMVMTGIALAYDHHSPGYLLWPWKTLFTLVADVVAIWTVAVWVLSFGIPLGFIAWLHHLGRTAGLAPKWAATSADSDVDTVIDEAAITQALKQLRIPQVTDYLKLGQPMPYIVPCRQEGRGTYCEIRLPGGLPALEIAKQVRRERLAASLFRHTKEVWPTTGADNSHLKLWIADKGALEEGAGPYPLLGDGVTDVFKGVPFGRTLRGDPVMAPLMERNTITGGMPGQGKSSAARVIMCGAALDPRAELWIMIPDINFDFELMKRRCSRYVMGAEDEHVQVIRDWLADLRDEVQARGQLLVDHEIPAVTPKLASARMGLHPLVVLLEEAHVAIQHAVYGKEISQLLIDVVKLGRKRGIHVIVSTQAPTKDSMPRDVTRNCSNGIAFAVGDHVPNDALLGAGAYRAGHRATELIPGTDRGVAVVKGFSGERSEMVQVYFLSVDDPDQVTPLMERAMAEVMKRGGLPGPVPPVLAIEARSLLDDLATVLAARSGKVRLSDIPVLLRDLAPSWRPYQGLNGTRLRELLLAEGVRTTNARNVPELDPADLREVLGRRDGEVS